MCFLIADKEKNAAFKQECVQKYAELIEKNVLKQEGRKILELPYIPEVYELLNHVFVTTMISDRMGRLIPEPHVIIVRNIDQVGADVISKPKFVRGKCPGCTFRPVYTPSERLMAHNNPYELSEITGVKTITRANKYGMHVKQYDDAMPLAQNWVRSIESIGGPCFF